MAIVVYYGIIFYQTNTFQGIIITDGNQSYALFTYFCGLLSRSDGGTIGFNSDGNYFRNHPLSGSPRLSEVACLNSPRTAWSNILYSLTPKSGKFSEVQISNHTSLKMSRF